MKGFIWKGIYLKLCWN